MFRNNYVLDVKGAENRIYRFQCESNSPLGETYDALYTMLAIVAEQINKKSPAEEKKPAENEEKVEVKDAATSEV